MWIANVHGKFWNFERSQGTFVEHAFGGQDLIHDNLPGKHVYDPLPHLHQGWAQGLCSGHNFERRPAGCPFMVPCELSPWWNDGAEFGLSSNMDDAPAGYRCMPEVSGDVYFRVHWILFEVVHLRDSLAYVFGYFNLVMFFAGIGIQRAMAYEKSLEAKVLLGLEEGSYKARYDRVNKIQSSRKPASIPCRMRKEAMLRMLDMCRRHCKMF